MTDYKVGDTIKTQDTYYEYILVIKDIATSDNCAAPLRAEVIQREVLTITKPVPADWPVQKNGTVITLMPEEVASAWEEDELGRPVMTPKDSIPSMPGNVIQRAEDLTRARAVQRDTVTLDIDDVPEDVVNHPKHYTSHPSGVECIQVTEHMGFNLGNALKYIWRADLKHDNASEDLNKALWYIKRELEKRNGS